MKTSAPLFQILMPSHNEAAIGVTSNLTWASDPPTPGREPLRPFDPGEVSGPRVPLSFTSIPLDQRRHTFNHVALPLPSTTTSAEAGSQAGGVAHHALTTVAMNLHAESPL